MHQRSHRRRSAVLAATGAGALALALLSSPVAVATDPGASPEATPSATSSATPTATPSATPSESPTPEPTGQPEGSTPAPTLPPAEESAELSASSERLFDEALTVEEALAQVGKPELVAAIARANNVKESVATSIVDGADPTVRITPSGHISFFEPQSDGSANTADVDVEELRASLPPSANPQDGSYPESTKTIFLNFEGVELTNTYWNEESGEAISVGASGLNAAQQEQVWAAVAEDYAPFGVNVVIDSDPEGEALHKSSGDDQAYGVEVVVYAGEGGPADGAGGVALMNSFGQEGYNTAFVSVDGTGGGNPLDVGLASSHEAGHTFGLFHDSHEDSDSGYYSPGDPSNVWGPIMGAPYGSPLSQWSDASYGGGLTLDGDDNEQDDVADITDREGRSEPSGMICELPDGTILYSGFSYNEDTGECGEGPEPPEEERGEVRNIFHDRADYKGDDHGDDTSTATALDGDGDFSGQGVIGQADDVDYFRIDAGNGPLNVEVSPSDFAANLPVDVVVYDADGNEIGSDLAQDRTIERQNNSGGVSGLGASFESDGAVEAGEYYVEVRGGVHGDKADSTADLAGGWDRYGSLGHYSLTATSAEQPAAAVDITAPADGDT
ncbi:MAG TPA: hypothetical protein VK053_09000, partial [Jiangellaceae bacterium]|nr:hypothetical protein [Jiangellaceae bacterium]